MCAEVRFTKENLDTCLKRLAKEFRKMNGSGLEAEIILIGRIWDVPYLTGPALWQMPP